MIRTKGAYQADLDQAEDVVPAPSCLFRTRNSRVNATGERKEELVLADQTGRLRI